MNKLLVSIEIPSIEQNYDLFIPVNKKVGTIKKFVIESIYELSEGMLKQKDYLFIDIDTGVKYENDIYVRDSGIKNGARIMVI